MSKVNYKQQVTLLYQEYVSTLTATHLFIAKGHANTFQYIYILGVLYNSTQL